MPFFHVVTTEIDAIVLSVHERIKGLLEDHSVKQLESHVQKWLQSQQGYIQQQ